MKMAFVDTSTLTREEYWKFFQKLIITADSGTTLATMGWVVFWLDHIPGHVIHLHFITAFLLLGALYLGLRGAHIMIQTGNRLGTRSDRFLHIIKIAYTLVSSISGIYAYLKFTPV